MANNTLTFRTARKHIKNYNHESNGLMTAHREAMECRDCEAFLQVGIDAYRWLMRAIKEIRSFEPQISPAEVEEWGKIVRDLREGWLQPCGYAEQWIAVQHKRKYDISNLAEFRQCCQNVRRMIDEEKKMRELSDRVSSMGDLASMAVEPPKEWTDETPWAC